LFEAAVPEPAEDQATQLQDAIESGTATEEELSKLYFDM
jgi:hypothetical protein